MAKLRLATSALTRTIYAGYPNKAGTGFKEPRHDVTSDALKAVVDHIGVDKCTTINEDGVPIYEITVRKLGASHDTFDPDGDVPSELQEEAELLSREGHH